MSLNPSSCATVRFYSWASMPDDISFAVIIELKDGTVPTVSHTKVCSIYQCKFQILYCIQDPPPWIPAESQHTTLGTSDDAEMHMIRAVNTGIINVRLPCIIDLFY